MLWTVGKAEEEKAAAERLIKEAEDEVARVRFSLPFPAHALYIYPLSAIRGNSLSAVVALVMSASVSSVRPTPLSVCMPRLTIPSSSYLHRGVPILWRVRPQQRQ